MRLIERSQNEIAQAIIDLCPAAEPLVEEWFAVLVAVRKRREAAEATNTRGAVDRLREVYRMILDADVGDWDRTIPTLAQYAEAGLREIGGQSEPAREPIPQPETVEEAESRFLRGAHAFGPHPGTAEHEAGRES
jgi:hypothetical protein